MYFFPCSSNFTPSCFSSFVRSKWRVYGSWKSKSISHYEIKNSWKFVLIRHIPYECFCKFDIIDQMWPTNLKNYIICKMSVNNPENSLDNSLEMSYSLLCKCFRLIRQLLELIFRHCIPWTWHFIMKTNNTWLNLRINYPTVIFLEKIICKCLVRLLEFSTLIGFSFTLPFPEPYSQLYKDEIKW